MKIAAQTNKTARVASLSTELNHVHLRSQQVLPKLHHIIVRALAKGRPPANFASYQKKLTAG